MPKEIEQKIRRSVNKSHPGYSKKRKDKIVYGTMRKKGLM